MQKPWGRSLVRLDTLRHLSITNIVLSLFGIVGTIPYLMGGNNEALGMIVAQAVLSLLTGIHGVVIVQHCQKKKVTRRKFLALVISNVVLGISGVAGAVTHTVFLVYASIKANRAARSRVDNVADASIPALLLVNCAFIVVHAALSIVWIVLAFVAARIAKANEEIMTSKKQIDPKVFVMSFEEFSARRNHAAGIVRN